VKLRNSHLAVIERRKVVDYVLNSAHPDNGGKAKFFEVLGFSIEDPEQLLDALRAVAVNGDVFDETKSLHGQNMLSMDLCRRKLRGAPAGLCARCGSLNAGRRHPAS
jgi:hypothetical protein